MPALNFFDLLHLARYLKGKQFPDIYRLHILYIAHGAILFQHAQARRVK